MSSKSSKTKNEMHHIGTAWGMLAATIAWNKSNDCKECNGTWRKKDFTLCECSFNAPFSAEEIEKVMCGVLDQF